MPDPGGVGAMRYAAFVSYNHRDRKAAGWVHRAIETYRLPRRLRGRDSAIGPLGARLPPIFRDRDELSASADLAASVRAALEQASALIVVCSPNGAKSRWVNEEIRAFTALGGRDRIQCLIVDGVPNASRLPGGDPAEECLPPALFEEGGREPLASDIRPGQDGRSAAKLKLIAGIIGLPYDELRQRENARRQRRLAIFATASAIGFVIMATLAMAALIARREAISQRDLARQKTLTAERTVDFVKSMFEVADPSEARGNAITAREVLDRGAARIDRELMDEPAVKADIGTTLGEVYTGLGLLRQGHAIIERMLSLPGVDAGTRARQYLALGESRIWQSDDKAAITAFERALALAHDPATPREDLIGRILAGLSEAQTGAGAMDGRARANARAALSLDRRAHKSVDVARDLEALGLNYLYAGQLVDARRFYAQALAIRTRLQGKLHPRTIQDLLQLGSIAYLQPDSGSAEAYFREVLPLQERVLGRSHPDVATSLNNLARILIERRNYAGAVPLLRRAVAIERAQRSGRTSDLAFYAGNLGIALRGVGRVDDALVALEQARVAAVVQHHRNLAPILADLADIACDRGQTARGLRLLDEAAPIMTRTYPGDNWRGAWIALIRARCLAASGRLRAAAALLVDATPKIAARWSPQGHYGARRRAIERLISRPDKPAASLVAARFGLARQRDAFSGARRDDDRGASPSRRQGSGQPGSE